MKLDAPSQMARRAWLSAPSDTSIIDVHFYVIRQLLRTRHSHLSCSPPQRDGGQRSLQKGIEIIRNAIRNFRPNIVEQEYGEVHDLKSGQFILHVGQHPQQLRCLSYWLQYPRVKFLFGIVSFRSAQLTPHPPCTESVNSAGSHSG